MLVQYGQLIGTTGLVIEDTSGNQFVWVPVDGENVTYTKWCVTGISHTSVSNDVLPTGITEVNQINTYGGFYIARYEAMFDYNGGSIRAGSRQSINKDTTNWTTKRNVAHSGYLWNYINYTQSKSYSEDMAASYSYDVTRVRTGLVTGTQWDTVMKWIQNSGNSVTNSRSWGNYSNSVSPANVPGYGILQISGYSDNWKAKNIYDLSGNTWEWTNEIYNTNFVNRGGVYNNDGSLYPAAYRDSNIASSVYGSLTFRMVLYIL